MTCKKELQMILNDLIKVTLSVGGVGGGGLRAVFFGRRLPVRRRRLP